MRVTVKTISAHCIRSRKMEGDQARCRAGCCQDMVDEPMRGRRQGSRMRGETEVQDDHVAGQGLARCASINVEDGDGIVDARRGGLNSSAVSMEMPLIT